MDHMKILKRAWQILWSYRALWVFGIILALTAGGSGGSSGSGGNSYSGNGNNNNQGNFQQDNGDFWSQIQSIPDAFAEGMDQLAADPVWGGIAGAIVPLAISLCCLMLALMVVMTFLRYISETALLRMVDRYEESGEKVSVREGFRLGRTRAAWRIFLVDLLFSLPVIVLVLALLALIGFGIYFLVQGGGETATVIGIVTGVGLILLFTLVVAIISALLTFVRNFAIRYCALQQLGVIASIREALGLIRRHFKDAGLMWLIMIGLGIAWLIATIPVFLVLIPVFIIAAVIGLVVGGVPALAVGGLLSLFMPSPAGWIIGGILGFIILMFILSAPMMFVTGLVMVFQSNVWTLTYRELLAMEKIASSYPPALEADSVPA